MNVKSYAKVNLGLNILYKRIDNYHELESIMVLVSLHDDISFEVTDDMNINFSSNLKFINNKTNLIYKIAKYLQEEYDVKQGVNIHLEKNIPVSGGMGGGSSNAATTILTLNKLWNLNLEMKKLLEIGESFGADIPFCINQTPAVIKGIGEIIEPFEFEEDFDIIVVKMPFGLSTKQIFSNFDSSSAPQYSVNKIKNALVNKDRKAFINSMGNNLEEISFSFKYEIKEIKEFLLANGCFYALMSGSGPTVLGFIDKGTDSSNLIKALNDKGFEAYHTHIIHNKSI